MATKKKNEMKKSKSSLKQDSRQEPGDVNENNDVMILENQAFQDDKVRLSTDTIAKIIDVHRMLDRLFHHYFAKYNITSVQIPVLMALVRYDKLMVSQLASLLHIGSSNITPLCKRLEKSGLITRTRDMEDQRVVYVSLTKTAVNLMEEISQSILTLNDRQGDAYAMSDEDAVTICKGVDVLYKYTSNLLEYVSTSAEA